MRGRFYRKGFTLIELLVSISVIAILAAIVFSVARSVNKRATAVSCLSQMRQIGTLVNLYLGEHRNTFFPEPARDTYDNWIRQIDAYHSVDPNEPRPGGKSLYKCPADKTPPRIERTYRFNRSWGDRTKDGNNQTLYGQSLYNVVNPSKKIMVFCVGYNGPASMPLYKADTDTWNDKLDTPEAIEQYFSEYPRLHSSASDKKKSVNLLFVDGHAESAAYPLPPAWYHFDRPDDS